MTLQSTYTHFSQIAPQYRELRSTDSQPIEYIASKLGPSKALTAADIGCGAGRYDYLLFRALGESLRLFCVDQNEAMLEQLDDYLREKRIARFQTIVAPADEIPLEPGSLDCVLTFNAVHHFPLRRFLEEGRRLLKPGGAMFIYTRSRRQNARSVWGRHFPGFSEKEDRLHEVSEMTAALLVVDGLELEEARAFRFPRAETPERLMEQARRHHYSTLSLYEADEFEGACARFRGALERLQNAEDRVTWDDENILYVIRKSPPLGRRPVGVAPRISVRAG